MNLLFLNLVSIGFFVFGILWLIAPHKLLSFNTKNIRYDNIDIHMTRTFGLTLVLSSIFGLYAINKNEKNLAKVCLISYLIYSIILIILQNYANQEKNSLWNTKKHLSFGTLGLCICVILCLFGLYF